MFKKRIKAFVVACVLVCILPTISCAIDKDNFLKFLINSSYPETKSEEDKNVSKNTYEKNKDNNKESNNDTSKNAAKEDYIKVHVGEENIPDVSATNTKEVSSIGYTNDIRITKENPRLLIYHTHGGETYSDSPEGNYHSQDKKNSVMEVGSLLTNELSKKGWGVLHTTKYHDSPSYNDSYASSLKTIQELVPKYNSIDIAIDLHRDARTITDTATMKKFNTQFTTTINGEKVARFFFVVGRRNKNFAQVEKIAKDLTAIAEKKYPGLVMPIVYKEYGHYNQIVAENHMLIEIGSNANSIKESKATTKYVANILDEYFKSK